MNKYFVFTALVFASFLIAQPTHGVAEYSQKRNLDGGTIKGERLTKELRDKILKRVGAPIEYELFFDTKNSLYRKKESLDTPGSNGGRIQAFMMGSSTITHTDLQTRATTIEQEIYGKKFLVKDTIQQKVWNFTGATKQIGKYTAHEATYERVVNNQGWEMLNNQEEEPSEEVITVSVWFTPEIPISAGPLNYSGLPGLVLMVQDNRTTWVCTKVTLNPKNRHNIKPPTKGEVVSQAEFDAIQQEKTKEVQERFRSGRGSENRQIIIGR